MKVLITSLSAGSGHVQAAEAVLAAIRRSAPTVQATHVDVADFVTPNFRRLYVEGYQVTVNHAPALWGQLYRYWDAQPPNGALMPLLIRLQRACAKSLFSYLHNVRPDRILTTHFLIPQLLGSTPDDHLRCLRVPLETVITDYDVHQFWISPRVSRYYIGHQSLAAPLVRQGVPLSSISATGIPVHPKFSDELSRAAIFQSLKLDPLRPVILILSGGLGLYGLQNAVERLLQLEQPVQLITVSGKNAALQARLEKVHPPAHIKLLNLGYVRHMHELLTISDLVVTKPGGLTVAECLAKNKIMLLFNPIPGQEEKNAEFLVAHGAALKINSFDQLPTLATQLLSDSALRTNLLRNSQRIAHPHAAYAIAESLVSAAQLAA